MANLKITIEVDLEEIKNLSYLIHGIKILLHDVENIQDRYIRASLIQFGRVIKRLDSFTEQIDPLVEN